MDPDGYFVIHTINAFDEGDDIVIDLESHTRISDLTERSIKDLRHDQSSRLTSRGGKLKRVRLSDVPSAIGKLSKKSAKVKPPYRHVTSRLLVNYEVELPRFNDGLYTRTNESFRYSGAYRFIYAPHTTPESTTAHNSIIKIDIHHGGSAVEWLPDGDSVTLSEPVFVARPIEDDEPIVEDDGIVLVVSSDCATGKSHLIALDAITMTEVARAEAPQLIPVGFHSYFVNA
jgi:carotenoid cleavage dioxygenase-like enzyme